MTVVIKKSCVCVIRTILKVTRHTNFTLGVDSAIFYKKLIL